MHLKLISLLLILSLLISFPACAFSAASSCDSVFAFDCGNFAYLAYPFWGGTQPQECGRSGFELLCTQNILMLNISSIRYRVQEIDFSANNRLRVARDDLLMDSASSCPQQYPHLPDTDLGLFKYPPDSKDTNMALHFGCKLPHGMIQPFNSFRCSADGGVENINFFGTKPEKVSCKDSISVPINKGAAQSLKNPTSELSINNLRSALNTGFWIHWIINYDGYNKLKPVLPFCDQITTYGDCIGKDSRIYRRRPCNYQNLCDGVGGSSSQGPPAPVPSPQGSPPAADENPPPHSSFPQAGSPPVKSPARSPVITRNGTRAPSQSPVHLPQSSGGAPSPFQSPQSSRGIYGTRDGGGRPHNKTRKTLGVELGVTGGIVVLIAISVACFIKRKGFPTNSADQEKSNYKTVEAFLLQHGPLALKRYKYYQIKKMTKSLSDKLGQGGYGSVYKGNLPDGTLVAVKVLSSVGGNVEDFVNEVASISRTSHVNIVNLLGFCFDRKKRALVYEYMPNKSLDKYIGNGGSAGTNCCLDMEILYRIAVGVAEGLDYLHRGCNTKIVHFDIKPQNILLDEDFCPKISDFGLAKLCKKKHSLLSVLGTRGTVGYIAPEVFSRNFGGVSHKSDVYSYGMMVLEMAGANMIAGHTNETTQSMENYFPDKIYERVLDKTRKLDGFEIEVKEETARKMLLIGFWCIQTNPLDRPSISKVVEMLEGSVESIQIPPKPVLFTPTLAPVWGVSSSFSSYVEAQPSAEGVTQTQFKVSVHVNDST